LRDDRDLEIAPTRSALFPVMSGTQPSSPFDPSTVMRRDVRRLMRLAGEW
jgi:hypothetical protein